MNSWNNSLLNILKRLKFNPEEIQQKIDGIKELMDDAQSLEPYNHKNQAFILLPSFSSVYGTAYLLLLPDKGVIYDCADDEKTGTGDRFEQYVLVEGEVNIIKAVNWPQRFKRGTSAAKRSRSFQLIFD